MRPAPGRARAYRSVMHTPDPRTAWHAVLADLEAETARLLTTTWSLSDDEALASPSLCDGWSRAHVLTHLARNADGLQNLCRAVAGEATTMYAGDAERDRDIADGARRPASVILEDVAATASAVGRALAALVARPPADLEVDLERTPGGPRFRARALPGLRLREVAYHHVDLVAGAGFADLPDHLQDAFLADEVRRLTRHPAAPALTITATEGHTWTIAGGGPEVRGPRAAILQWLARGIRDGLDSTHLPDLPEGR